MPRRKKLPKVPNYEGTARNPDSMIVQKSNPLQSLSETKMTLPEFKILDAYLSRINSSKPDERYVRFEKGELEKLLGVSRILKEDLNKRLKNLFQVVTIKDKTKRNGFTMIALFEKAEAFQDDDGLWQVDLACTPSAIEYIFNINDIGYLPYLLKNVIELTSRYSYILFLYLENNRFRKSWTEPLGELKALLRCTADTYTEYKRFNDLILKKCHKELNEKTNIKYSYEPVKSGRKVTAVRFTLKTRADEDLQQLTLEDVLLPQEERKEKAESEDLEYKDSNISLLAAACNYEFNNAQMENIFAVISTKRMPEINGDIWLARYHYLAEMYAKMNVYAEKKPIPRRYGYFVKMLQNDKGD